MRWNETINEGRHKPPVLVIYVYTHWNIVFDSYRYAYWWQFYANWHHICLENAGNSAQQMLSLHTIKWYKCYIGLSISIDCEKRYSGSLCALYTWKCNVSDFNIRTKDIESKKWFSTAVQRLNKHQIHTPPVPFYIHSDYYYLYACRIRFLRVGFPCLEACLLFDSHSYTRLLYRMIANSYLFRSFFFSSITFSNFFMNLVFFFNSFEIVLVSYILRT